jgi:mannose-6-phosphate isomerase-like protein (cupin superfamily)
MDNAKISRLVNLTSFSEDCGDLTVIEENKSIPFSIKRSFYIYNVPERAFRGNHAHYKLEEFLVALSGEFDVTIDNGQEIQKINLCGPDKGLYIPPLVWRKIDNFSKNAICLVLASHHYDENDYCRNYQAFLNTLRCNRANTFS